MLLIVEGVGHLEAIFHLSSGCGAGYWFGAFKTTAKDKIRTLSQKHYERVGVGRAAILYSTQGGTLNGRRQRAFLGLVVRQARSSIKSVGRESVRSSDD